MNTAGITEGGCHPDDPMRFPEPVEVEVDCRVWDLSARPDLLTQAAKSWRDHGDTTSTAAEEIHRSCRNLLDSDNLKGDVADRFNTYESELITKLDEYEGVAERVAEQLDDAAASVTKHQKTLDGMRQAILAKVPGDEANLDNTPPNPLPVPRTFAASPDINGIVAPPPTHIVFRASSFNDLRAIEDAKSEAEEVRAQVDKKNADIHNKLVEVAHDLGVMGHELTPGPWCGTGEADDRDRL